MILELEVYALEKITERCFKGFLKKDGSKIVLKPAKDFSDSKVIQALHQIQMQKIPHILGYCMHQDEKWFIHTWQAGKNLVQRRFTAAEVELLIKQVKQIIRNLNQITNSYWFFPDLKPEHILEQKGNICLIDFEHVLISQEEKIAWASLAKTGITNHYCSADLKQDFLSLYHHDYILALLSLELIQGERIGTLNRKMRKKLLAHFSPEFQKELTKALQMQGFSEFQQKVQKKSKQNMQENRQKIVPCKTDRNSFALQLSELSIKAEAEDYLEQFKKVQTDQNFIRDLSLDDMISKISSFFSTYLQKDLQEFSRKVDFKMEEIVVNDEKRKVFKIYGIRIKTISPRYFMPIYNTLDILCLHEEFTIEDRNELIEKLFELENNLLQPDLLTNFIASHIVKRYEISDFLINNQYIEITNEQDQAFVTDQKSLYQFKKGVFAVEKDVF